jgi:hypothetical protein
MKIKQFKRKSTWKDFEKGTYFVNVFDKIKWFLKLVLFWNKRHV